MKVNILRMLFYLMVISLVIVFYKSGNESDAYITGIVALLYGQFASGENK